MLYSLDEIIFLVNEMKYTQKYKHLTNYQMRYIQSRSNATNSMMKNC
jgi:hypothetical protein